MATLSLAGGALAASVPSPPELPTGHPCLNLNQQLQGLNGRLNSLEDMTSTDQMMSMIMSIKNIVGMIAIVPNGSLGAAVLLADPQIIAQIAQQIEQLRSLIPGDIYKQFTLNLAFNANLSVEVGAGISLPSIPQVEQVKLLASGESSTMNFGAGGNC